MKAAYADPPYLGCGQKHYGDRHEAAAEYDSPDAHKRRTRPGTGEAVRMKPANTMHKPRSEAESA